MVTLRNELYQRGYRYNSMFTNKAIDIYFNSSEDLCYSLGYILRYVKKLDAEIPNNSPYLGNINPNYTIVNGLTSGGNVMKEAPQLRIYFVTTLGMPPELCGRLQNDNQMRITGSFFVEACMYIGFVHGNYQNKEHIKDTILEIFDTDSEQEAFWDGYES